MKKVFALFIAFTALMHIHGEPVDADRSGSYFEEIKFEFVNNKIIIPVTIEGTKYRFLFDTGAPNVISKDISDKLKPKVLKTTQTRDAAGNTSDLSIVQIPEIFIGNTPFKNTKALTYDLNSIDVFRCYDIDGFIGSNLLRNSIVQINFDTRTITITDNKHDLTLNKNHSTKMELVGEQNSPFIFIDIEGKRSARDQVLIDTGTDGFYDITHRSYDIFKDYDILKDIATAKGGNITSLFGNSAQTEQHRVFVPKFNLAGTSILKLVTTTTSDNISRIGTEMLKQGLVTIDFKNKRFYFETEDNKIDASKPLPEITPTVMHGRLVIGYVWDEKLKRKADYGDEIIQIDNRNISKMTPCEFMSLKQEFEHRDTLNIRLKTKTGKITELTLVKKLPKL